MCVEALTAEGVASSIHSPVSTFHLKKAIGLPPDEPALQVRVILSPSFGEEISLAMPVQAIVIEGVGEGVTLGVGEGVMVGVGVGVGALVEEQFWA